MMLILLQIKDKANYKKYLLKVIKMLMGTVQLDTSATKIKYRLAIAFIIT